MAQPARIFVIGHMGAGKSMFAEALAKALGWQFVDANPSLERYIGRSLREILGESGEAAFHQCEAEIIAHYQTKDHFVAVLEESVVATEQNRKLLANEYVIYLQVSVATQIERMQGNREPLLPIDDMNAFLNQQHQERDHLFTATATQIIDSIAVDPDVAQAIQALNSTHDRLA